MTRTAFWGLVLAFVLGPRAVADVRADDICAGGCVGDMRSCLATNVDTRLACRAECKAERPVGRCLRDCRVAFRAGRTTCRTDVLGCLAACEGDAASDDSGKPVGPAPSNPACPGTCGAALGQCLGGAAHSLPECLASCPKGPDRHACVDGCRSAARDGRGACAAEHDACLAGCGGATTTTSTTIPLPPPCEQAVAPTCGGTCPEPALTCAEIEPGICGCVGGSPSAAFVVR